jgi:hypothetical protein
MSHRIKLSAVLATLALGCLLALRAPAADEGKAQPAAASSSASAGKGRFFEMRTYYANEGKVEALDARFREHTNKLFVKHGMDLVGYWHPVDKPNVLVYILGYPSREAREKSWAAFNNDPEWKAAKAKSEEHGGLVAKVDQVFMTPTDYSPLK